MKALLVPPKEVPTIWGEVAPLINKSLHGEEDLIAEDFLEALVNGEAYMWIVVEYGDIESAVFGEIITYPRKKSFYINAWASKSGYRFDECMELFTDTVIDFAKNNGCSFIEAKVRKGLAKKLNWNDKHSLVTLTL